MPCNALLWRTKWARSVGIPKKGLFYWLLVFLLLHLWKSRAAHIKHGCAFVVEVVIFLLKTGVILWNLQLVWLKLAADVDGLIAPDVITGDLPAMSVHSAALESTAGNPIAALYLGHCSPAYSFSNKMYMRTEGNYHVITPSTCIGHVYLFICVRTYTKLFHSSVSP